MNNNIVHTEEVNGYRIEILYDPDPPNPRDWDNLGTMICRHKRYELGDVKAGLQSSPEDDAQFIADTLKEGGVVLFLWLYDHSGIMMRATSIEEGNPFHCPWDSGLVGFIFVTALGIRKEYGLADTPICDEILAKAKAVLEHEVKTYDQYLRGECYGFCIMDGDDEIDSCWGFYQNESPVADNSYILMEARAIANSKKPRQEFTTRKIADKYRFKYEARSLSLTNYLMDCADDKARDAAIWMQTRHPDDCVFSTIQQLIEIEEK